jgi:hypothetical protein
MPAYRESFVFRLATDEPAIFWTGAGDLYLDADDVLPEPVLALGSGELLDLPDLEALINGVAQRVEIRVSGVSPETLRFAQEEADQVTGAAVHIGRIEFDEEWQIAGPVVWEWQGEAQKLTVGSDPAGEGRTRTITLHVAAGDKTRARAPFAFFTDADQRREYPTDAFFDHVGAINAGTSRRWGPSG